MDVYFTNSFYKNQAENLSDYIVIDVTSRVKKNKAFMLAHPGFAKDISPFFVGPVKASDGEVANIFEHFWQCGKVYPCHYINNQITPEFFEWRKKWYEKTSVSNKKSESRHPNKELGYEPSDCLFNIFYEDGVYKHLDYIEARKKLYAPEYAKLIVNSESFKWLKSLLEQGKKIAIVDFDGFNYYSDSAKKQLYNSYVNYCKKNNKEVENQLEDYLKIKNMKEVINCSYIKMGHGFVIKMLLQGDIEVKDGEVIDKTGILK